MSLEWVRRLLLGGGLLFLCGLVSMSSAQTGPQGRDLEDSLEAADELREQRQFREALSQLSTLRNDHPENVDVLRRLAFVWADLGKAADDLQQRKNFYVKALSHAQDALSADSTSAWAHLAVAMAEGRVALNVGTQERVERSRAVKHHADRAIDLDSTLAGGYHVRGRWHREVASLGFFQRALLRTVYGGLPDASYEQAVRDFQRAIELEKRTFHHLELGKTYIQMGRTDAARRELKTCLQLSGSDPFAPEYKQEAQNLLDELD